MLRRMRKILGLLLVLVFLAPAAQALTTHGAGVLTDGLVLSVFDLSRSALAGRGAAPFGALRSEAAGGDLASTSLAAAPGLFPLPVFGQTALLGGLAGAVAVPEPGTYLLLLSGLVGLSFVGRKQPRT